MAGLPNPDEMQKTVGGWGAVLKKHWRHLGTLLAGFTLAIAAGLHIKGDLLRHALDVSPSFTALDSPWLWIVLTLVFASISLYLVKHQVSAAVNADAAGWRRDRAGWLREDETNRATSSRLEKELNECREALAKALKEKDGG